MRLLGKIDSINIILLLLLIGCLVFFGMYMWPMSHPHGTDYNGDREQIKHAVPEFMQRPTDPTYNHTLGDVPIVNNSVIPVNGTEVIQEKEYYVVAICPLLTSSIPKGIIKRVPKTVHPRNCLPEGANAQPNVTDCSVNCTGRYLWLTTSNGDIASVCIGKGCEAHGEDGYQIAYP